MICLTDNLVFLLKFAFEISKGNHYNRTYIDYAWGDSDGRKQKEYNINAKGLSEKIR